MSIKSLTEEGFQIIERANAALAGSGLLDEEERQRRRITALHALENLRVVLTNIQKRAANPEAPLDQFIEAGDLSITVART